jgi:hypothetical protein
LLQQERLKSKKATKAILMEIEFIKWMTLTEVAQQLSETSDTELTEMDVLELAAYCRLRISAQFTEPVPARKGIISPRHSAGDSERVVYEKSLMPGGVIGVLDLWIVRLRRYHMYSQIKLGHPWFFSKDTGDGEATRGRILARAS